MNDLGGLPESERDMSETDFELLIDSIPSIKIMTISPHIEAKHNYKRLKILIKNKQVIIQVLFILFIKNININNNDNNIIYLFIYVFLIFIIEVLGLHWDMIKKQVRVRY